MTKKHGLFLLAGLLLACLGAAALTGQNAALASATIIVNTTNDELNNDSDCSLREAIIAANTDTAVSGCTAGSGNDTIEIVITGMVWPVTPLPDITSNLNITGPGYEDFGIPSNVTPILRIVGSYTVSISGLNFGASVYTADEVLRNEGGTVTLNEVYFSDISGSSISTIHNTGTMEILNTFIVKSDSTEDNQAIWSSGNLTLVNTVVDTKVKLVGANATIMNSILPRLDNEGGVANIQNSVISGCVITNGGVINSLGHNLDTESGCGFSAATNDLLNGLDPKLVTLPRLTTNYALLVTTLALLPDSPLIDAGDNTLCSGALVNNRDYRGQTRPLDGDGDSSTVCDIGAVEYQLNTIPQIEYDALVAIYNAMNGPSWGPSAGWLIEPNACNWGGVACNDNHVSELDLQLFNLIGIVPAEIVNLTHLKRLGLRSASIPSFIGDLTNLEFLRFSVNSDPPQLSIIPAEIGDLTNLRYLSIDGMLTGTIPPEIANLSNLEVLSLSVFCYSCGEVGLNGEIPPELGDLTELKWLSLWNNDFTGSIPPELGNLVNLQALHLVEMPITGSLPPELGSLSSVLEFWLYDTNISGTIPPELGNLSDVRTIILTNNQLTGTIPPVLAQLPNLIGIALDHNQLTGSIPPQFGSIPHLEQLFLHNNQLSGTIPAELGNVPQLQYLFLQSNRLSGSIPSSLGNLPNLYILQLQNNQLSGEIPLSIVNLDTLKPDTGDPFDDYVTNFGYNMLTNSNPDVQAFLAEKDPDWADTQTIAPTNVVTGTATQNAIMLNWTPIAYTVPPGYYEVWYSTHPTQNFQLHNVTADKSASTYNANSLLLGTTYYFKVRTVTPAHGDQQNLLQSAFSPVVSGTTSTGSTFCSGVSQIPTSECQALVALYTSTNGSAWTNRTGWMVTNTPCSWYGVQCSGGHVTGVGLNENHLVGVIPSQIGSLVNLTGLSLYGNQLVGSIPTSIGGLTQLQLLALDRNQLSGSIPNQIGNLANLQHLYLDRNQLSGSIPASLGNLTNLAFLHLFQNQLTGSIPPELGNLSNLLFLVLYDNQLTGTIPTELGELSNLDVLMLQENQLQGNVPASLGSLSNLGILQLGNNQLSGEIPLEITNLTGLGDTMLGEPWDMLDIGYNGLYSNDPDVVAFLNEKDADWALTQTIAPADVQVVGAGVNSIELAWTPIPYTGHGGSYQVWYSTSAGGPYTLHGSTANKFATGYTAGGLLPNSTYYFVVRTVTPPHDQQQNAITSGNSGEVSGTTEVAGLNAPSHLNVVSSSQTDTDLSWRDNSPDETVFEIERSLDGLSGWLPIATVPPNQTLYTDSSLNCNTPYFYRVRAFREGDNTHSAYTNIASATTYLCTPPAEPSNVTATGVSLTQIDVTWTDNSVDEDSFHIERSGDGVSNWQEVGSVGMDETSYSDTGLLCNRLFFYRVRAFRTGDAQYSLYSNVASGATLLCLPPNAPALVSAVGVGINKITVTWQDNSLDESSFSIEMSAANQDTWAQVAYVPANQTSYTHEGLLCGTSYDFRVRAYRGDDGQYSLPSGALQGTTLGCPPPVPNTAGMYQNGGWLFRDTNSTGIPDVRFRFGPQEGGWTPLVGDWDGDGIDGIGLYKDGMWLLRNSASSGQRDLAFSFNPLGTGALPIVGDWNGDGVDTIGVYKEGLWVFRDSNSAGQRDHIFNFTPGGSGWQPIAGDWNGDYYDTVGLYKDGRWYLLDALETPSFTSSFKFGPPQSGWTAIVGDWDADGEDTIGLYRDGVWRLRNSNSEGGVDVGFSFLPGAKEWTPVAGYRGGIVGLSALGLSEELPVLPTLEILPTATLDTSTPTESVTPAPEVTEMLITPTDTPTATLEPPTETPTQIPTESPPPTEILPETVAPEATASP